MLSRSASWSSSHTNSQKPENEEKECVDPNASLGNNNRQNRRYLAPSTPKPQHSCKARSFLPPLQPLSIDRRSLDEWPRPSCDDIGEWPQPPTPSGNKCGERLKLDLSSIQRNPDRNGGLVKRDKIAFFDKECSKVAEHVYLGGDAVAKDRNILKKNGITHVLNCVGFVCQEYFKEDFVYRTLWLQDSGNEDIISILYDVFDYFEDVREQAGRIFVHCCQGVSRSTSLVIAYLMWREGQSFEDAFQYVKSARGIADPNMGFACQLLQCQKRVHAVPLSPNSLLRMYRLAPHSQYDPLHLVPKKLDDPSPSALDSRGAFIVNVPSAIYLWIGKRCEAIMERDARAAVCQIVRYERVQAPTQTINDGDEPEGFWNAFSTLLPLMNKYVKKMVARDLNIKFCPGERKVDSYDVDYEIFQKAVKGGVVPKFGSPEAKHENRLPAGESTWSVLKLKFASGNMKNFVPGPKISLCRVYSDSRMIVHSSSPSMASSLLSSSSSPDSMSSDSSACSKNSPESSLDSPSAASHSLPVSSISSDFSNLSLRSSKTSLQAVSNVPELHKLSTTLQKISPTVSPLSKNCSPSLAERRGSLSKSLNLPVVTENVRMTNTSPGFLSCQDNGPRIKSTLCNSDSIEIVFESKHDAKNGDCNLPQMCKFKKSESAMAVPESSVGQAMPISNYVGSPRNNFSGVGVTGSICMEKSYSGKSNPTQSLVCRWPSLERMQTFGTGDLDSKSAFAIVASGTALGQNMDRILYFWIGSSFCHDSSKIGSGRDIGNSEDINWNLVGGDLLTHLGLSKDIPVKVAKQDKEPEEFLSMLNMM